VDGSDVVVAVAAVDDDVVAAVVADVGKSAGKCPSPVKGTNDCVDGDGEKVAEERKVEN
jgi:hypothetical protein